MAITLGCDLNTANAILKTQLVKKASINHRCLFICPAACKSGAVWLLKQNTIPHC